MLFDDGHQPILNQLERLVPRRLAPGISLANLRGMQPVGVFVQFLERNALGTDVALAEAIRRVATHGHHRVVFHGDLQTARRFAQGTDSPPDSCAINSAS